MSCNIFVLSNGVGEDTVAKFLIRHLLRLDPNLSISVFPLVKGVDYSDLPIAFKFMPEYLPSSGMTTRSISNFVRDTLSGGVSNIIKYVKSLKHSPRPDLAVIIGDPFLLFLGRKALKNVEIIFVSLFKSEIVSRHYFFEIPLLKKSLAVITRDAISAEKLKQKGVNALYFGNPMVDSIQIIDKLEFDKRNKVILLLPGSREYSYSTLKDMLSIVKEIKSKLPKVEVFCALSSNIDKSKVIGILKADSWNVTTEEEVITASNNKFSVKFVYGAFGNLLSISDVVISAAGTATEQSIGFGKPTLMFINSEMRKSVGQRWIKRQKILLGESISIFSINDKDNIVEEVKKLLTDEKYYKEKVDICKNYIEGKGSIEKIAKFILKSISENAHLNLKTS